MRRRVTLLLSAASLVLVGLDAAWLAADAGVQTTDAAYHFSRIAATRAGWLGLDDGGFDGQRYGGLVHHLGALLSLVVSLEPARLLLAFAVLLRPLLLFATYRIGAALAPRGQEETGGVLAALFVGLVPGLTNYGRVLVLDLPLAVAVAWAMAGALELARSQASRALPPTAGPPEPASVAPSTSSGELGSWLRLGIGVGCALSIKLNAAAFLLGPALVLLLPTLRRELRARPLRFVSAGATTLLASVGIAGFLLTGPRGSAIRRTLLEATWPGAIAFGYRPQGSLAEAPGDWWRATLDQAWEATYFATLQTFSPPLLAVVLLATLWFFARRRGCEEPAARTQRLMVFSALALPLFGVVCVLRGLFDERYLLPLLPIFVGLVGCGLAERRGGVGRRILVTGLLVGGAINAGFVHWNLLPTTRPLGCTFVEGWAISRRADDRLWLCLAYPEYRFMDRLATPSRPPSALPALRAALTPLRSRKDAPLRAVFLDDLYDLFYESFQDSLLHEPSLLRHQDALLVTDCWNEAWMRSMFETPKEVDAQIRAADVVIMRYGDPADPNDNAIRGRRCDVFWSQEVWFAAVAELPQPDGTHIKVFAARALLPD